MLENKITFTESHNFLGECMTMKVNDKIHYLEHGDWGDYSDHAILLLKTKYGILMKKEEINFEWDETF